MFEGMEPVEFEHEGTQLRGYAARPDTTGPVPAVLVMHSALGIAHGVNEPVARKLAAQGYLAVCTDMYGAHLEGAPMEDAGLAYGENLADPDRQRARTVAWFDEIARRSDVDDARIAAVGFCYGGTTVLELARSGADLKAAISYHGILTTHAPAEPGAIPGHVVAYCGAGDPYAPLAEVDALRDELQRAGVRSTRSRSSGPPATGSPIPMRRSCSSRACATTSSRTISRGTAPSCCWKPSSGADRLSAGGGFVVDSGGHQLRCPAVVAVVLGVQQAAEAVVEARRTDLVTGRRRARALVLHVSSIGARGQPFEANL